MNNQQIKLQFAEKVKRFYAVNGVMIITIAMSLWAAKKWGVYQQAFIPIVFIFFIWIFNIDKLYRCPVCKKSPRGKQGLIHLPSRCTHCHTELR